MQNSRRRADAAAPPALELRGIVKHFPGVLANDRVDLAVERGEIRALLGENGAGKTTLMRVLYGLYPPDDGEILLDGEARSFRSPTDAIAAGLGMVHQHFMLFPSLTVAENVVFGREPHRRGLIDRRAAARRVAELAEGFQLEVDPRATVADLPVGLRQRVEILKTLYRQAQVLILDEPTAVLTPQEADALFGVLRRLAAQGKTIVFITHKLREVMDLADRATVLRDGRVAATVEVAETSPTELCRHMVGRDLMPVPEKAQRPAGDAVLRVEDLVVDRRAGGAQTEHRAGGGRRAVDGISFEVRAGEIAGIAGVAGNGQSELVAATCGLRQIAGGRILLAGRDVTRASVAKRRRAGLACVPEDTAGIGLALDASVADNLIMGRASGARTEDRRRAGGAQAEHRKLTRRGVLSRDRIQALATRLIERFAIKTGSAHETVGHLSGGNRQKVVVAREVSQQPALLIAEQPTQGVDVGAAEGIQGELLAARDAGRAVLLVSADLGELMALADRILVMFEGRIAGEVSGDEADEQTLGLLAAGGEVEK